MTMVTLSPGSKRGSVSSPLQWRGKSLELSQLSPDEQKTFVTEFEGLIGTDDSVMRALFRDRRDEIEAGIMAIKQTLNDPTFQGTYPDDQGLGICQIRPMHVGDTSATPDGKTNWSETITTGDTKQAWIGASSSDQFLVGGYSGDQAAAWGGLIIIGVASKSLTQSMRNIKFWNDRLERVPINIEDYVLRDNTNQVPVLPIPTEVYLPGSGMYAELTGVTTSAVEKFKLVGLAVGLGKLLKRDTYA